MSRSDPDIYADDAKDALLELARLLGRVAADEAIDQSTVDISPFQLPKKGACDDKQ